MSPSGGGTDGSNYSNDPGYAVHYAPDQPILKGLLLDA